MANSFFAVTSLGKDRWYWVVWPSLEQVQSGELAQPHLAHGYEKTKAEAVERALDAAGHQAKWLDAKYARQYHQQQQSAAKGSRASSSPVSLEFLYRDVQEPDSEDWFSVPHRVARKTAKYVYVEQRPYEPEKRTGTWEDESVPTFRLSRKMLEEEGYALTPVLDIDDPLFFTAPIQERLLLYTRQPPKCFTILGLDFPCTKAEVRAAYRKLAMQRHPDQGGDPSQFLELQAAYEQALRLCQK